MISSAYEKVKLGDVVTLMHQGINTAADKVEYAESGVPIIQSKHFTSGTLSMEDTKFLGENDEIKYGEKYTPKLGDILFSNIGTVGKSVVLEDTPDFMFAWNVFLIRLNSEQAHHRYIKHFFDYLLSLNVYERWFTGGTVKFLNKKTMAEIEIPLPPLDEQKRIAAILDKADSVRRKRQQAIDLAEDFLRSVFLDMFGDPNVDDNRWESLTIGEIGGNENSKRVPLKQADRDLREGPFPYYGATGIIDHLDDYIFDGSFLLIAEDGKNLINRTKPLAFPAKGKFWVNNHAHVLSDTGRINLTYLEYFLNFKDIRSHVTGIDQFKLNRTSLDRIKVFNPSMKLQKKFEGIVMKTKSTQCDAVIALKESHNCFNSLSQKAFAGEL